MSHNSWASMRIQATVLCPCASLPMQPVGVVGGTSSSQTASADWPWAPQRVLYPNATARPSSAAVAAFMKENGIDYIYADAKHPNTLVSDAVPVARSGDAEVLRVP